MSKCISDRIKELRNGLELTQQQFADKLKTSRANVAGYEAGTRFPSDAALNNICREFNVNEEWLRNGTGEMFIEMDDEDRMMEDLGRILGHGSAFQKRFVKAFLTMTDAEWQLAERKLKEILGIDDAEN